MDGERQTNDDFILEGTRSIYRLRNHTTRKMDNLNGTPNTKL